VSVEHTPLPASVMALDRVIHEPARLVILSALATAESAEFRFLEFLTGLTAGNLSSHIAKLEAATYVTVEKTFRDKRPLTTLKITPEGRAALQNYRQNMKRALA
jgi:DNA-binding MarR family transcriptional regulator